MSLNLLSYCNIVSCIMCSSHPPVVFQCCDLSKPYIFDSLDGSTHHAGHNFLDSPTDIIIHTVYYTVTSNVTMFLSLGDCFKMYTHFSYIKYMHMLTYKKCKNVRIRYSLYIHFDGWDVLPSTCLRCIYHNHLYL